MNTRYFILGTDTGCGKTHVTCHLLNHFRALQKTALAVKPVTSGCLEVDGQLVSEDATRLAFGDPVLADKISPWRLLQPISPHLAARADGVVLSARAVVDYCLHPRFSVYDYLLIEGAGGLMVPLNEQETWLDVLIESQLPVVLVVGMRLGCINHTLLTAQVLKMHGIPCVGWVANCLDKTMQALASTIQTLQEKLESPCWMTLPYDEV